MRKLIAAFAAAWITIGGMQVQAAGIQITEWMYNGNGVGDIGEFMEFTNMGPVPVDMTGWSFDDNSRAPGSQSLSAFGTVAVGESVILTDLTATDFRTNWGLPLSVKVIGGNTNNIGRSDEINVYDSTNALIDRLTYNDQGVGNVDGPRTNGTSANPLSAAIVGANNASQWILSVNGDVYGSYLNTTNLLAEIANPGHFLFAPIPEPSTLALAGFGLVAAGMVAARRRAAR